MIKQFQYSKIIFKGLYVFVLLLLCQFCYSQDVILASQSDVDAFDPSTTVVSGNLYLGLDTLSSNITNISNLSNLSIVEGDFFISDNNFLPSLNKLSNLSAVNGSLKIYSNPIYNINGLSKLRIVGNDLIIENNSIASLEGLSNLEEVGGDFIIIGHLGLNSIENFNKLKKIKGHLNFQNNKYLVSISGFEALDSLGSFSIWGAERLTSVDAFNNLESIEGSVVINNNDKLEIIEGFQKLSKIKDYIGIYSNNKLIDLNGFSHLDSVYGNCRVISNDSLTNLNGLSNLRFIGGNLEIETNESMLNLEGLNMLNKIVGDCLIEENMSLLNLEGLTSLDSIIGELNIGQNLSLINLQGLVNLSYVGENLFISNNKALERISEMPSLSEVGETFYVFYNGNLVTIENQPLLNNVGRINITSNFVLENIDGLSHINTVQATVHILYNDELESLDGLNNITSIGETFTIFQNPTLTNLNDFSNLVHVGESLTIMDNIGLTSINGFNNLTEIPKSLKFTRNHGVLEINGFSNLKTVGERLSFFSNNNLNQIKELSNLETVELDLTISYNDKLTNLDFLPTLNFIGNDLKVTNNEILVDCCGIRHLLEDESKIGGDISIYNNPSECSNPAEVLEGDCGMVFTVNPNPPCQGADNGSFQINISDYDTIPFTYHWIRLEDGIQGFGETADDFFLIDNLVSGTYDITITNTRPDTAIRNNILLPELDGTVFEIIEINTTNSSNGTNNGSINLKVSGGSLPYSLSWEGMASGNQNDLNTTSFSIPMLNAGTYHISASDADGFSQEVSILLLDETLPDFPCQEPLDIVILNDVSGSVDATEYKESRAFFLAFLNEVNIGLEADESRASFIEWSGAKNQEIIIPMTGSYSELNEYAKADRAFFGSTSPHQAMEFGYEYLEDVGREDVEKVLILSTDGSLGQISSSLVSLADEFKANGYNIITIAFDYAFTDTQTRKTLQKVASIKALAPGAPSYSDLDEDLAANIVNLYLCPIDPGSSATVFFNRDGAIEILGLTPEKNCPYPEYVEIEFMVSASRELSIPSGTPVTFYLNDPTQFGATKLLTWKIPCSIPVGTSEIYKIAVPISGPSLIYAVLNDDGIQGAPINFPITELEEIAYSNNIDYESVCLGIEATLHAIKYSTSPTPACDTIVNYTINVCNISEVDAFGVTITDEFPAGFVLTGSIVNTNNCAIDNGSSYDIPAYCCVSLSLTYDASGAALGYYGDQDVILGGPSNQTYYDYDGESSSGEDVNIDGSIDCPSTVIEFTKEVNVTESCDDAFLVYTFTINNEMNIPIQGLTFSDIVPSPSKWAFEPYEVEGLSLGSIIIEDNEARFTINEVEANTVARFSLDLSIGKFASDGEITNTATLENVPDPVNGGFKTLISNSTTTQITASPEISIPDTIVFHLMEDTISLSAIIIGIGEVYWTSAGDGIFLDGDHESTQYILGIDDKEDNEISLFISVKTACSETGKPVIVLFEECQITIDELIIGDCDDNGTNFESADDVYAVQFNLSAQYPGSDTLYYCIVENDTLGPFTYGLLESISLSADGINDVLTFIDSQYDFCNIQEIVNQQSCSDECNLSFNEFTVSECDDAGTSSDDTDDTYSISFNLSASNPGLDSTYLLIIGNDTLGVFSYDIDQMLVLSADGIEENITFVDSQLEDCILLESANIESCSNECILTLDGFNVSDCDDNGTPENNTDDTYSIEFTVSASNSGTDSLYYVLIGNDTIDIFPYGEVQTISLTADGLDDPVRFVDSQNQDCFLTELINMESCSDECSMNLVQFDASECDDNGTPFDYSDDIYTIAFRIQSSSASSIIGFNLIIDNETLGPFLYNDEGIISLAADGKEDIFRFVDAENENCVHTEIANIESCSENCKLNLDYFNISECEVNRELDYEADDTYSITFNLSISSSDTDSFYSVFLGDESLGVFSYGIDHSIILSADGLEKEMRFIDTQNEDCNYSEIILLEDCSVSPPVLENIIIPNIFTPNNDNNNDNWSITINNNIHIISCIIYDRWGNKVYANIQDQEVFWDGKYNGRDVSQGVYVYKVIYQGPVDNMVEVLGDLTLIR